jgi:protein SCO1/2
MRAFASPVLWVVLMAFAAGVPVLRALRTPAPPPPPVLGALPPFRFTSEQNLPFGTPELTGKVWIANFIFTRCPTICPVFSAKMAEVQRRSEKLGSAVHLVSFSVDPTWDTPERLKAYGGRFGADPNRWTFLTGEWEALKSTIVDGMKISAGREGDDPDDLNAIFHGTHFVLVDERGQLRGYYDSNVPESIAKVVEDAGRLAGSSR